MKKLLSIFTALLVVFGLSTNVFGAQVSDLKLYSEPAIYTNEGNYTISETMGFVGKGLITQITKNSSTPTGNKVLVTVTYNLSQTFVKEWDTGKDTKIKHHKIIKEEIINYENMVLASTLPRTNPMSKINGYIWKCNSFNLNLNTNLPAPDDDSGFIPVSSPVVDSITYTVSVVDANNNVVIQNEVNADGSGIGDLLQITRILI